MTTIASPIPSFKDFNIKTEIKKFIGEKMKMKTVLGKQIKINLFKIGDSKFKERGSGKCLHLQFEFENKNYVCFTGATGLMDDIQKVPTFPFFTTIIEKEEIYYFT